MKKIIGVIGLLVASLLSLAFIENKYNSCNIQNDSEAKKLFNSNCSLCHSIEKDKKLIGPSLYRIVKKNNEEWVFIHLIDSKIQINKNDRRAIKLYNEYQSIHPTFEHLTSTQIKMIIKYLQNVN